MPACSPRLWQVSYWGIMNLEELFPCAHRRLHARKWTYYEYVVQPSPRLLWFNAWVSEPWTGEMDIDSTNKKFGSISVDSLPHRGKYNWGCTYWLPLHLSHETMDVRPSSADLSVLGTTKSNDQDVRNICDPFNFSDPPPGNSGVVNPLRLTSFY